MCRVESLLFVDWLKVERPKDKRKEYFRRDSPNSLEIKGKEMLHTWLPNAMEAPTPVSALLHAATLVTAGVYLIIRTSPILEMVPSSLMVVSGLGGLTALYGAIAGLYQNDIKRIIAYSTCSQLGYMVMACGVSQYSVALYHLVNHAYFKALLFLSAGCIIHGVGDEQ